MGTGTIWFTGLSGSGKTTVARHLKERLEQDGRDVEILDGDELRAFISSDLGFSQNDRLTQIKRAVYIAKLLNRHHVLVLACFISPYRTMRQYAREQLNAFAEIYVNCPIEECIQRDPKGLYKHALSGKIQEFTGISSPYEEPDHPDLILYTGRDDLEECVRQVTDWLKMKQWI